VISQSDQLVPVAAVIFTHDEEVNIEACLKSIEGWCQEIFVVDSGSTDRTLEICRKYTDHIHSHPYVDHSSQWDWALKNLPFVCEWVLRLDADNVVSSRLKEQIRSAVAKPETGIDGYYATHRHFFRNRPIRGLKTHWLSLIRHKNTHIDHSELVDFRFVVKSDTRTLPGEIIESNQKELSIDFWIDKHKKFSSRMAVEELLRVSGTLDWSMRPRLLGNPDERMIWLKNIWYHLPLYVRPFLYFFYRYFLRLGFLDGTTGFVYHFLHAFWFRLMVDIKISELRQRLKCGDVTLEQLSESYTHK
jgi:glycosyltransferase involved in cell wall biosynthesis